MNSDTFWTLAAVLIVAFFLCAGIQYISDLVSGDDKVYPEITFAGKVVNSETGEWPNERLVLLFLKGQEIGRDTTTLGEFLKAEGKHDGLFRINIKNDYDLTLRILNENRKGELQFARANHGVFSVLYLWIPELEEGSSYRVSIPSKNIQYVIKVVKGDIATLPPELRVANSTTLTRDNTIIVSLKDR